MNVNRITTRVTALVTWEARPGVELDPQALAEAIKATPWNSGVDDTLDQGVEVGGQVVTLDNWDLVPEKVEVLSQKL